jgi:ABC-type sulfate transport system permease subunit
MVFKMHDALVEVVVLDKQDSLACLAQRVHLVLLVMVVTAFRTACVQGRQYSMAAVEVVAVTSALHLEVVEMVVVVTPVILRKGVTSDLVVAVAGHNVTSRLSMAELVDLGSLSSATSPAMLDGDSALNSKAQCKLSSWLFFQSSQLFRRLI